MGLASSPLLPANNSVLLYFKQHDAALVAPIALHLPLELVTPAGVLVLSTSPRVKVCRCYI